MIFNIKNFGMQIENDPQNAEIIIVNTCAFLESARSEAIESILEMSEYKQSAKLEKLIVTGCINELNYQDLQESLPEVNAFVRLKNNVNIVEIIANLYKCHIDCPYINNRILTTPKHYAYLKISEGCNNFCTYCLIPYIRGRYKSTPMEDLVEEAKLLAKSGVKELILVAQDVTKYGIDIYRKKMLVPLIQELSQIEEIKWIRLLYCYPEEIDDLLINEIKTNPKVLKYIDVPLQHVSTKVLHDMNRRSNYESINILFNKIKTEIPDLVIRSTFILGFPGETEDDIKQLQEFLTTFKLNNVGFFTYSREEGTKAFDLPNQIDENIKQERFDILSQHQYNIMQENNSQLLGTTQTVIVDDVMDGYSICRFYGQSPLIDTIIYIPEELSIGEFYKVKITKLLDYDLEGEKL
jgi:ribosomal protein S12 methylthiotransferase